MSVLATFVAAVLLSRSASAASGNEVSNGNAGHSSGMQSGSPSVDTTLSRMAARTGVGTTVGANGLGTSFLASGGSSSSSSAAASAVTPAEHRWATFCGSQPHERCLALYASAVVGLLVLLSVFCAWWVVRWWRCGAQGLHGWRRVDRDGRHDDANDDAQGIFRVDEAESEGLLANERGGRSDIVESSEAGEGGLGAAQGHMSRCVQRLNLHGTRLWTFLRETPAGLFTAATPPSRRAAREARDVSTSEGADGGHASLAAHGDTAVVAAVSSSTGRPYLRTIVSVATTTADSSESCNDSGHHSEDGEALNGSHDPRHFLCESECLEVEVAEGETAVRRSAVTVRTPNSPITPHILPQLINYNTTNSAAAHEGSEGEFGDNTDSDSQRMSGPPGQPRRASSSSLTASANSSAGTPSFLNIHDDLHRVDSEESVSRCDASERDGANSPIARLGFPHVETAIFDTTANACVALPTRGRAVDPSIVNALFEPDHFPHASSHATLEAPISSVASHCSALDCHLSPPSNAGTATPPSMGGSGLCLPLPCAITAALPVSNSLNDGLDMEGEGVVEELDASLQSRSYVPATQQQQQQQHHRGSAAAQDAPKPRRKRSSSYYSEPWQPVVVQHIPPQAAVAVVESPVVSTPIAAVRRHSPLLPPRPAMGDLGGDLEDELDDLMLDDDSSAQSNQTGESGHIFSGSSTSTSRTVTPATENDPESMVGTPTMFCAAAMANGGHGGCVGFLTVSPPASASIPLHPESPPAAIFAQTMGVQSGFLNRSGDVGRCSPPWRSCSAGRRPLHLSVEERTLLMRSSKWLFPLIDGADEIETGVVGKTEVDENDEEVAPVADDS